MANKRLSGYKVHLERLLFAADTSTVRTFKFPLVPVDLFNQLRETTDSSQVLSRLIAAIKHDDLYLRGPSNLVDYLKFKNSKIYSLIDFWLDSLRLGIVFMPSTASLMDFVTSIKKGKSIFSQIFEEADSRIQQFFKPDKFIEEIIIKREIRRNKSSHSFRLLFQKIMKDDLDNQEKEEAEKFINQLVKAFFDSTGALKVKGASFQNQLWKEQFGLDKEKIDLSFDLTFYCFPELAVDQINSPSPSKILTLFDLLIKKRKLWLQQYNFLGKEGDNYLDKTLGLSDNFNAFSNYFGSVLKRLKNYEIDCLLTLLEKISPLAEDKPKVKRILTFLADRLQYLEPPTAPRISGWHDYRTLLGGKLQSWWTNHKRRTEEQINQLEALTKSLVEIEEFINKDESSFDDVDLKMFRQRANEIKEIVADLRLLLEKNKQKNKLVEDFGAYEILVSLINRLRQLLNEFWQLYYKDELGESEKEVGQHRLLKNFFSLRIYKPRNFYGYSQREDLEKIVNHTFPVIENGLDLTIKLVKSLSSQVDYQQAVSEKDGPDVGFRRLLEVIRLKCRDNKVNTEEFRQFYFLLLRQFLSSPDKFEEYLFSGKYTFFKSRYSASTQSLFQLNVDDYSKVVKKLIISLIDKILSYRKEVLLQHPNLLLDWIEASKLVVSRLFRWSDQEKTWRLDSFDFQPFPSAKIYIEKLGLDKVKTAALARIIMSYVFSDFRGSATIFSKRKLIVKYNIQPVNGLERYQLIILPKNTAFEIEKWWQLTSSLKPEEMVKEIKWMVNLSNQGTTISLPVLSKSSSRFGLKKVRVGDYFFQIITSKYQLQFLERLIYKPRQWKRVKISVNDPSLIVEERYHLDWNLQSGLPESKRSEEKIDNKKPVFYYALPFTFQVERAKQEKTALQIIKEKSPDSIYYLGADIGEYGIAWAIIKVSTRQIEIKDSGFLYDKRIKKIQERFREIQQRARQGLFLEASTVLAQLREQAIGYLRNRLHHKLLTYQGEIVYEANISGFEKGVGRVTKIYDSVKRPDVGNHPDAVRDVYSQLIKHIWGLRTGGKDRAPGWQVAARGTSYTCLLCGRSIYGFKEDKEWRVLGRLKGNSWIWQFQDPDSSLLVLGYSEKEPPQLIKHKFARKYFSNFARPPIGSLEKDKKNRLVFRIRSEAVNQFVINRSLLNPKQLRSIRINRGNSALFICPFQDCLAVVDADIQAAVVIALRGYLYNKAHFKGKDVTKEEFKKNLADQVADLLKRDLTGKIDFIYSLSHR